MSSASKLLTKSLGQSLKETGFQNLSEATVTRILEEALQHGGSLSELFLESTMSTRVVIESAKLDRVVDGIDQGIGLRVIFDGRSVYGYTTDAGEASLLQLAQTLSQAVKQSSESSSKSSVSKDWRLSTQSNAEIAQYKIKKSLRELPLAEKVKIAKRIEAGAKKELPESRQVMTAVLDTERKILVINSDGLISQDSKVYFSLIADVVGEKNGRVESAYKVEGGYAGLEFLDEITPESVGQEAARRTKTLLNAKPAPSGTLPVVIAAEAGGTMIHEAVGHGLEADLACNGLSVYQNKIGQSVASPLITVLDDGTMPAKRGSYAFDDEGTPSKKTTLIEGGVLKNYMVDRLSAMKFDLMATGNGRRETFRHKPIVRMTNTYIAPGKDDPKKILTETKKGIFVKAMGGGQVNTVTGDFVFAVVEGYLIQDGKLGDPIRGATLVGNGPKVLSIVDRVGSDLGFSVGTCGKDGQGAPVTDAQPTLRIPELTVGGEVPVETYWK